MGIFPHIWTDEETVRFRRIGAMGVQLEPGMHVLDTLYPHPDEDGGCSCDHIVITRNGDGCHTLREDGTGGSSTVTAYYRPKLTHLETFCRILQLAVDERGVESFPVEGYEHQWYEAGPSGVNALPYFVPGQYHVNYLPGLIKLWKRPQWQAAVIEGLIDVMIATAPKESDEETP